MRRDNEHETMVKGNNDGRWRSDGVMLWLGRRQNRDVVEWWGEWVILRWPFYRSGERELGGSRRMAGGGADSMLRFRLERVDDMTKHWRKMKWRQRAHLGSMRMKCDMTQQCGDVGQRIGGTGEGKERRRYQLGWRESLLGRKIKKIHVVDLAATKWMIKI
jgi:hypothetical protein